MNCFDISSTQSWKAIAKMFNKASNSLAISNLKTCGQEEVIYLITTQNFFLLVPGLDMYEDSGNAKILDFFGLVPKL